jgi:hypothetical protein
MLHGCVAMATSLSLPRFCPVLGCREHMGGGEGKGHMEVAMIKPVSERTCVWNFSAKSESR